jgi:hypothetical protein
MTPAALELDFVRRRRSGSERLAGWAAAAATVVAVWFVARGIAAQDEVERLQERLDARQRHAAAQSAANTNRLPAAEVQRRLAQASAIVDELAVPWGDLFRGIEAADGHGLGLLTLVPNAHDGSVRLTGEARSVPVLLAYLDRLGAQPMLTQVHLLGYETVERDGLQIVAFTVEARWQHS